MEGQKNHQLSKSASDMSPIPGTPSLPTVDNVQMDVDSNSDAEQVARELAQAQERVRIINEARVRRREEWKRLEEEEARRVVEREAEEEKRWIAVREVEAREVEELLEMERQYQLQVSTGVIWNST